MSYRNAFSDVLISIIEPSPHDPATAYVAATRYKFDDFRPFIYKTTDYGKTWRRITAGIPDNQFIRVVREDPVRRGLLYAGGEFGVYVSFDDGAAWQPLRLNLPVVPIHDLVVKDNDLIAATHGRSFWILDDVTPLHQLTPEVARAERHLFKPRDAWRVRGGGGGGGGEGEGGAQARGIGRNPPSGAVVFAYFRQKPEGEVTLEFLNARDSVIRRFSTKPRAPTDSLKVSAGMNRFVWNLRYPDASRFDQMILWGGGTQGPVAVPGTYKARLTAGSWNATQSFEVKKDPLNYPIMLNNRISWLAGVVGSADAPPTEQSVRVFEELSAALQVQLDRLKAVLETDVPAFNRRVRELDVPALSVP